MGAKLPGNALVLPSSLIISDYPNVITLSAFLSVGLASGSNFKALYTVPVVLLIGAFIGLVNAFTVLFLRIPSIIATLGMGYIITTAILIYNPYLKIGGQLIAEGLFIMLVLFLATERIRQ